MMIFTLQASHREGVFLESPFHYPFSVNQTLLPTPSAEHCKMPRQNQINLKISHKSPRKTGTSLVEQQEVTLAYKLKIQQWRHAKEKH